MTVPRLDWRRWLSQVDADPCPKCKGNGFKSTSFGQSDFDWGKECTACKGTGWKLSTVTHTDKPKRRITGRRLKRT